MRCIQQEIQSHNRTHRIEMTHGFTVLPFVVSKVTLKFKAETKNAKNIQGVICFKVNEISVHFRIQIVSQ